MLKVSLDTVNIPWTCLSYRYTVWKGCLGAVNVPWTFLFHRYTVQKCCLNTEYCLDLFVSGTLCRKAAWTLNIPWTFFHRYAMQKGCLDTFFYRYNAWKGCLDAVNIPWPFLFYRYTVQKCYLNTEYSLNLFFTGTPHGQAPWTLCMPWCWRGQQVRCTWVHLYPPGLRQSLCWGTLSLLHGQCRMWVGWSSASPNCQWGRFRVCGPGSSSSPTSRS